MRRQFIAEVNAERRNGLSRKRKQMARLSNMDKTAQRPQSLADRAFDEIEEMIVGGTLSPGALISESELSRMLKTGRTPIREAIARLKFIGFVDVHSRKGISVSGVDVIRHLEVLEVRRPLEQSVALHAIERATDSDISELREVSRRLNKVAKENDRIAYFRVKRTLHDAQVRAAHNEVLAGTMRILQAQARRFWWTYEPTESFPDAARLHCAITDNVIARDTKRAAQAVHELFNHLETLTKQVVERRGRF
jgi:DNA-binding GntR family transcriptional regulator